jgi:hypothetical protein
LPLHIRGGGGLSVALLLELLHGALLSLQLPFQLSDLFPLQFDKGIETAGLRFTFVGRTFPGDWLILSMRQPGCQE